MIDCLPNSEGDLCVNCGWIKPAKIKGWPHRNCPRSPDLAPAAAKLGLTPEQAVPFHREIAQWIAAGMPERTAEEQAAIAATPCESRREDGICDALGCKSGANKSIKCAYLAQMATQSCPLGKFIYISVDKGVAKLHNTDSPAGTGPS